MVKLVQKNPAEIDDVQAKPATPGLEDLAAAADANEAGAQAETMQAAAKTEDKKAQSLASEIEDALDMAAPFAEAGMWWLKPGQFEALWGKPSRKKIAVAAAAVMLKHGWELGAVLEKYAPYIALGMALAPSAVATVQLYKQAKNRAPAAAVVESDGSNDTTS